MISRATLAAVLLLPSLAGAQEEARIQLSFPNPAFSLHLPRGYSMEISPRPQGAWYAYAKARPGSEPDQSMITVSGLGGTIVRNDKVPDPALFLKGLPAGARAEAGKVRWNDMDVDLFVLRWTRDGTPLLSLVAQVPLEPESIQVVVYGSPALETELREDLGACLASLKGRTFWLTDTQRTLAWAAGVPWFLGLAGLLLYGVSWFAYFRAHPATLARSRVGFLVVVTVLMAAGLILHHAYELEMKRDRGPKLLMLGLLVLPIIAANGAYRSRATSSTPR